jgi:hypothetical protein
MGVGDGRAGAARNTSDTKPPGRAASLAASNKQCRRRSCLPGRVACPSGIRLDLRLRPGPEHPDSVMRPTRNGQSMCLSTWPAAGAAATAHVPAAGHCKRRTSSRAIPDGRRRPQHVPSRTRWATRPTEPLCLSQAVAPFPRVHAERWNHARDVRGREKSEDCHTRVCCDYSTQNSCVANRCSLRTSI